MQQAALLSVCPAYANSVKKDASSTAKQRNGEEGVYAKE